MGIKSAGCFSLLWWTESISHQLAGGLSVYLQGFVHPNWCCRGFCPSTVSLKTVASRSHAKRRGVEVATRLLSQIGEPPKVVFLLFPLKQEPQGYHHQKRLPFVLAKHSLFNFWRILKAQADFLLSGARIGSVPNQLRGVATVWVGTLEQFKNSPLNNGWK